jgi:hypothetical protein
MRVCVWDAVRCAGFGRRAYGCVCVCHQAFVAALMPAVGLAMGSPAWRRTADRALQPPPKSVPFTVRVSAADAPPTRPSIHDYACDLRALTPATASECAGRYGVRVAPEDVLAFMGAPLDLLRLDRYVFFAPAPGSDAAGEGGLSRTLPFDLSANTDAASYVGQQMLARLQKVRGRRRGERQGGGRGCGLRVGGGASYEPVCHWLCVPAARRVGLRRQCRGCAGRGRATPALPECSTHQAAAACAVGTYRGP